MEKVRNHTPEGTLFVVQEKVHGSNCSFFSDGQQIHGLLSKRAIDFIKGIIGMQ